MIRSAKANGLTTRCDNKTNIKKVEFRNHSKKRGSTTSLIVQNIKQINKLKC